VLVATATAAGSIGSPLLWGLFLAGVLFVLALDLGVFHREEHVISTREAAIWTGVWIALSLLFNLWVYLEFGPKPGLEFLTGYVIEKALSVDNIFVFILIFAYFGVPAKYQHRVLFWGIFGALLMRGVFIGLGAALVSRFAWVLYLFGAFLVITGIKIMVQRETEVHPEKNPLVNLFRRFVPITNGYHGKSFFTRENGRLMATPLLLVLVVVEATDVVFAVDSIPAIFGITHDPFIVFTSNVGAILGLRAMYFLLAGMMNKFVYLKFGLGLVLAFIGLKMLIADLFHLPVQLSLGVVVAILGAAVAASLLWPPPPDKLPQLPRAEGAPHQPETEPSGPPEPPEPPRG
jgi:tellurite resistance protein TerC